MRGRMGTDFNSKLNSALSRSAAPERVVARDRRAIIRAGIDSDEKLLRAPSSRTTSASTLAIVGWLLPRWPGAARRLAYFDAARTLLLHPSPRVRAEAAVAMGLFRVNGAAP